MRLKRTNGYSFEHVFGAGMLRGRTIFVVPCNMRNEIYRRVGNPGVVFPDIIAELYVIIKMK